jgi:hypothetical protein
MPARSTHGSGPSSASKYPNHCTRLIETTVAIDGACGILVPIKPAAMKQASTANASQIHQGIAAAHVATGDLSRFLFRTP